MQNNFGIREFVSTPEGRADLDQEFVDRLQIYKDPITTLNQLLAFTRTRWAEQYSSDWRKSTADLPLGKESMKSLWARYLRARET